MRRESLDFWAEDFLHVNSPSSTFFWLVTPKVNMGLCQPLGLFLPFQMWLECREGKRISRAPPQFSPNFLSLADFIVLCRSSLEKPFSIILKNISISEEMMKNSAGIPPLPWLDFDKRQKILLWFFSRNHKPFVYVWQQASPRSKKPRCPWSQSWLSSVSCHTLCLVGQYWIQSIDKTENTRSFQKEGGTVWNTTIKRIVSEILFVPLTYLKSTLFPGPLWTQVCVVFHWLVRGRLVPETFRRGEHQLHKTPDGRSGRGSFYDGGASVEPRPFTNHFWQGMIINWKKCVNFHTLTSIMKEFLVDSIVVGIVRGLFDLNC